MLFHDIDLLISGAAAAYTVRITSSPRDRTSSDASFPISGDAPALAYDGVMLPMVDQTQPSAADLKPVGDALYRALLFDNRVQDIVTSTIAVAETRGSSARLRLQVEPPELRHLPWETLYRDPTGFLALSDVASITRFIAADGQPIRALLTQPPLKVLIVAASPKNLPPLDVDAEIKRVRGALADAEKNGAVKIYERRNPSVADMRSVLRKEGIHVLHFIGHGSADYSAQPGDQPVLAFAGKDGEFVPVSAEVFAANSSGAKALRLVVLNACETAVESTAVPLLGVASKLIQRAGLPGVLAMQAAVRDDSAVAFSGAFYRELAAGGAVDDAVREGRLAIFTLQEGKKAARDFIVPVLFLRDVESEGRLVDFVAMQRERIVDTLSAGLEADQNAASWSAALTALARTYTQLANWKTLHDILHELENVIELAAGELTRLSVSAPDLTPVFNVWALAGGRLEQLKRLASDDNTAIAAVKYVEAADGSLKGEAWAVRVVAAARLIDSALNASETVSLPRLVRDLLQTLQTYMNVSDKAIIELSLTLPLDGEHRLALPFMNSAPNGSASKAAYKLHEAGREILTLHAHLVERARLHDLLQDAGDAFRRVRDEMRGEPSTWDLLDIDAAWRFCRAAVLDSRLRPYAESASRTTKPAASGAVSDHEWALELFALAERIDQALASALSQQQTALVAEPSRQFDAALRRTFFITDKSLQTITAELQTLARQLLSLAA